MYQIAEIPYIKFDTITSLNSRDTVAAPAISNGMLASPDAFQSQIFFRLVNIKII